MFRTRLISGIVLVLIALVVIITGGPVLAATLFIISEIGVFELYRVLKVQDAGFSPLAAVGYLGTAAYYAIVFFAGSAYTMTVLLATLILCMGVYVFTYPRYRSDQVTGAFFGVVYVAVMLSCIYELRILDKGVYLVWLVFLGSWGCDTCAYCVCKLIGKHKMTPKLSPKKSVEGGIGGVAGASFCRTISSRSAFLCNRHASICICSVCRASLCFCTCRSRSSISRRRPSRLLELRNAPPLMEPPGLKSSPSVVTIRKE